MLLQFILQVVYTSILGSARDYSVFKVVKNKYDIQ